MKKLRAGMLLTAVITLAADLYTKQLAIDHLGPIPGLPYGRYLEVIPGYFNLAWAENTGGAFSFLHTQPWIIGIIAGVMVTGILVWAYRMPQRQPVLQLAFGFIIGGALGNLIDRMRFGYVVDFLDVFFIRNGQRHTWPTFNVADMGIVAGIGIFVCLTLFTKMFDPPVKAESVTPPADSRTADQNP